MRRGTVLNGCSQQLLASHRSYNARTVQQRLVGVVNEAMQHVGQMAYLRGIFVRRSAT